MNIKTQKTIAYFIVGIFLLIGVISYAGYSVEPPYEPIRIMFKSKAGNVLFDHKGHFSESGLYLACGDCHHADEDDPHACSECHNKDAYVSRADAFHMQCKGCHEIESGPVECSGCHAL